MAARSRGLLSLYIYIENFKTPLVRNHWTDFIITAEFFPWWPSTKIVQVIMIRQKTARSRAYFPYISIYKTLKIFFSETNGPISIQLGRNVSLVTLYKDCSGRYDSSKNVAARGRGLFSLYIYIENFKNLLVRNSWTEFNVTWQECCFGDLLPRLFKPSWYIKNHGPQLGGAYFSYISA